MGSFSWLRADVTSNKANVSLEDRFACLIPKEFGGGYIVDNYQDYGYLGTKEDGTPKYDLYELLAIWNKDLLSEDVIMGQDLLKEIDENTDYNRGLGICIGCYNIDIDILKYPLKLVSVGYAKTHTYEDCPYKSFDDTEQGFYSYEWKDLYRHFEGKPKIPKGYKELIRGRVDYLNNQIKLNPDKQNLDIINEIDVLEKFLNDCIIISKNLDELKKIKNSLDMLNRPYIKIEENERKNIKDVLLKHAKIICEQNNIDFKTFLSNNNILKEYDTDAIVYFEDYDIDF